MKSTPTRKLIPLVLACLAFLTHCAPSPAQHPDEKAVRASLERYFSTWSARDMEGYAGCFAADARVFYIAPNGSLNSQGLTDFLHDQRMAQAEGPSNMNERPLEMKIQGDARVAQAAVTWRLVIGKKEVRGTDFFTLQHVGNGWKIVSLVFYGE